MGDRLNRVAVLGSTGSVGTQALAVARRLRREIDIVALAGGRNAPLLSRQLAEFQPRLYHTLSQDLVRPSGAHLCSLEDIASDEAVDTVLVATSGRAGLLPALAALRLGKRVALASKEVLVMAGRIVMEAACQSGAVLLPVDSEHSAIWQCLEGETAGVNRLLLTASGGPFLGYTDEMLRQVTPADALAHPVWSMGAKISVDSATLMNKGLEVIEAHWLFDVPLERIQVLLHPECVVHSMVEFADGAVKAQMGPPDMALPIQYALTYPHRVSGATTPLAWDARRVLTFAPVDATLFPCLRLAAEACSAGKTYPAALCGADEAAVSLFLHGEVGFSEIPHLIQCAVDAHRPTDGLTVDGVAAAYDWAQNYVTNEYPRISSKSETNTLQV